MEVTETLRKLNGTVVTDDQRRPLILHHGTYARFDRFGVTRDIGFHFGTLGQAQARERSAYTEHKPGRDAEWRVISAALAIRNPIILKADPAAWSASFVAKLCEPWLGADAVRRVLQAENEAVEALRPEAARRTQAELSGYKDSKKLWEASNRLWDEMWWPENARLNGIVQSELRARGFDGIGYYNHYERSKAPSWCAFDPDSIVILGEALTATCLETPEDAVATSGYLGGPNPIIAFPKGARGSRNYMPGDLDQRRMNKAIDAAVERLGGEHRPRRCVDPVKRTWTIPHWRVPFGSGYLRIAECDGWRVDLKPVGQAIPDVEFAERCVKGEPTVRIRRHSERGDTMDVLWDVGETPGEVADRLISTVERMRAAVEPEPVREVAPLSPSLTLG